MKTQLDGVAGSFDPIYHAASQLKGGAVPEAQGLNVYDNLTPWLSDSDLEYHRRHGEALEAMNNIYRPGVQGTDKAVPVFGRLADIVDPPNPIAAAPGSIPGGPSVGPVARPGGVPTPRTSSGTTKIPGL